MKTRNWLDILAREWKSLKDWIVGPELEIMLHPSRRRLQMIGIFTVVGHLLFGWLWTYWLPQPYEDWRMRTVMAVSGLGFIFQKKGRSWFSSRMQAYFSVVCWLQLPFFFIWMYFMNSNSAMWMATVAVMIVAYYHLTDWRLATSGLMIGFIAAGVFAQILRGYLTPIPAALGGVCICLDECIAACFVQRQPASRATAACADGDRHHGARAAYTIGHDGADCAGGAQRGGQ
jgi:hypothetical protein